ncbi:hypothetical protein [Adlercreutzia sp. ZJ304]|uniref:hypothetical protein n=1 Tax=Adlercreutzia sp. ZJ304 TaxID=2709791 RepID=UPI0013EC8C05|nr:hypothetical protein [Adlercreutzia sp. ZJ304]
MAEVSLTRQFIGQARLVRLLLWRVGDSTDIDTCFSAAREASMLTEDDESFLRACLKAEECQRTDNKQLTEIDQSTIKRLRRCADKLNRADAA